MSSKDFVVYCSSFFKKLIFEFFSEFNAISFEDLKEKFGKDIRELRNSRTILEDTYKNFLQQGKTFLKSMHQGSSDLKKDLPDNYKELLGTCFSEFEQEIRIQKDRVAKDIDRVKLELNKVRYTNFDNIPTVPISLGCIHPLEITIQKCVTYFEKRGFIRVEGPQIEDEYHNFDALGITVDHPARDSQDSFYVNNGTLLLRTQTSPVQIRIMETCKPPIGVISTGRVFRKDAMDASHLPYFFQIEGLLVDVDVSFIQLKTILKDFLQYLFGDVSVRFRPDYFPFTEPSCEVSVGCPFCIKGNVQGCYTCKGSRWVEILGAGMVHPRVLRGVGVDPKEYSGFAFGCGIERIGMILNSIGDIRHFYGNDMDFLSFDLT